MNHLKPISKAEMTWFETTPADIFKMILSLLQALAPIVEAIAALKGQAAS